MSPSRERVCPCALMPMTLRPHGSRFQGQRGPPYACLAGSMSPDGRRKTRHGWFLHAHCLKPSCHLTVRVARMGVSFSRSGTSIMPHGSTHEPTWSCLSAGGGVPSRAHRHLSGERAQGSGVRGSGLRVKGSPIRETGPAFKDMDTPKPSSDAAKWGEGFIHTGIWNGRCLRCERGSTGRYRRSGSSMTPWGMKATGKRGDATLRGGHGVRRVRRASCPW